MSMSDAVPLVIDRSSVGDECEHYGKCCANQHNTMDISNSRFHLILLRVLASEPGANLVSLSVIIHQTHCKLWADCVWVDIFVHGAI